MNRQKKGAMLASWLSVFFIAGLVISSLVGAPPYGDDIRLHAYRIPVVQALWANGVPFARWIPTLNFGYGSPLFNFYPPLSAYLLAALYLLLNQSAAVAVNVLFTLALFGGAVGMFLLGRSLYGPAGGVFAAALYTWSPHLVYQSLARGSSSNALAMAFFPWAVWGVMVVVQRPSPFFVLLAAVPIMLLMLSHTAASLLFLGPLLVLAGTAVIFSSGSVSRWQRMWAVLLALLLGLALSAFAWLPALAEIGSTRYAQEAGKVAYQEYFADAFRWPPQAVAGAHNPDLPKSPGLAQMVLGTAGGALALLWLWRRRRRSGERMAAGTAVAAATAAVAGFMGIATLVLALAWSAPLWALFTPLQSLQFPWRLLDIPTFCLALAGGFVLYHPFLVNRSRWAVYGLPVMITAALLVAFANLLPYLVPPRLHTLPSQPTLADVTAVQQQFGIYGLTAWGEYSAATVTTWPDGLPFVGADEFIPLSDKVLDAPERLTAVSGTPWQAMWQSDLSQVATITLAVHDFPGWQARLDGERMPVWVDGDGRVQLVIPPGRHQIELAFTRTPVRWLADGLTLLALFMVVLLLVWSWRHANVQQLAASEDFSTAPPLTQNRWPIFILSILCLLFVCKNIYFDRLSTPLVVYAVDGRISEKLAPQFGNFNNEIQLAAYEIQSPDTLVLYWQALAAVEQRYSVVVTLADAQGVPLRTLVNDAPGNMSTSHWEAGQLMRDVYHLPLPDSPTPAGYTVWVALQDVEDGEMVTVMDGGGGTAVPVGRLKTSSPPSDVPQTHGTVFGEAIQLRQAIVPSELAVGETIDITLAWESLVAVNEDYTVFVHLLKPDGSLAAGQDGQPLAGRYPTSYWEPGEVIMDVRQWQPDLPAGNYQVEVGLYHLDSGERLAVSGPHAELGDRVILGIVEIRD